MRWCEPARGTLGPSAGIPARIGVSERYQVVLVVLCRDSWRDSSGLCRLIVSGASGVEIRRQLERGVDEETSVVEGPQRCPECLHRSIRVRSKILP